MSPSRHHPAKKSLVAAVASAVLLGTTGVVGADLSSLPVVGVLAAAQDQNVSGDAMQWHRTTVSFSGPASSETASVNPFLDYRLNVTFTQGNRSITVPGFFAGDGRGGAAGNQWQANFAPPTSGRWEYRASFRSGPNVAVNLDPNAGTATAFDGETGSFDIAPSDKPVDDFRAATNGRLRNTGEHYLTFEGSGLPFVKGGANIPENFFGYTGFDNTPQAKHDFDGHEADWRPGDPDWDSPDDPGTGDGRAIIGSLNYLAWTGANNIYFLPMNLGGDAKDTFPMISPSDKTRYDLSKLAQWETVMTHADAQGILLHVVLAETESANENFFDNGELGVERKLFYRELVARFGHHLGIEWDLGEENDYGTQRRREFAAFLKAIDGYDNPVTTHTHTNRFDEFYGPLLGNGDFDITAFQGTQSRTAMADTVIQWRQASAQAGVPWVISMDEPQPIHNDPTDTTVGYPAGRRDKMWPLYMSGGGGFEWYVQQDGGGHSFDQQIDDFRIMGDALTWTGHATALFESLPLLDMAPNHGLGRAPSGNTYVLAEPGDTYVVFNDRTGAGLSIDLTGDNATYDVTWFNPRTGARTTGISVVGGALVALGTAPGETNQDWAAVLTRSGTSPSTTSPSTTSPSTTTPSTTAPPTTNQTGTVPTGNVVTDFVLVDADTDTDIGPLRDGAVINLAEAAGALNVRAVVGQNVASVRFGFDANPRYQLENVAPFALGGDTNGNYGTKWAPSVGRHTITATPFDRTGAQGAAGAARTITINVIDDATPSTTVPPTTTPSTTIPTTTAPATTAPATTAPSGVLVTGFVLIAADRDVELGPLTDGAVIDLSESGTSLNVRAIAGSSVRSVQFAIDGTDVRLENVSPFALAGDKNGDYFDWSPAPGTYTITATPYSGLRRSGSAGPAEVITITVVR